MHQFPEPIPAPVVPVAPVENPKRRRVDPVEELVSVGSTEPVVVKGGRILGALVLMDLPAGNPRKRLAGRVVELVSAGTMKPVVVKGRQTLEATLLLVMVRVLQDNIGMVAAVKVPMNHLPRLHHQRLNQRQLKNLIPRRLRPNKWAF